MCVKVRAKDCKRKLYVFVHSVVHRVAIFSAGKLTCHLSEEASTAPEAAIAVKLTISDVLGDVTLVLASC